MGRWNENLAWTEFRYWLAAAGMGGYMAFSLYMIFFLSEPFAMVIIQTSDSGFTVSLIAWIFRILITLNLIAVVWGCLKIIRIQEGEWPN